MAQKPSSNATVARPKKATSAPTDAAEAKKLAQFQKDADAQYGRGGKIKVKAVRDKKLRAEFRAQEAKTKEATLQAKNAEILLDNEAGLLEPEHELERTYKVRQDDIKKEVGIETARKSFDLRLEMGPYDVGEYTRNGRDLLIASRKGHLACMDWREGKIGCEFQLGETIRDAKWLHNNQHFAVAQKNCVYIYARDGVEVHQLKKHQEATHLEFLPYHFLLASISTAGILRYTDTSTGQMLTEIPTKLGPPTSFCQNPHNAIVHAGHQKGLVTLWSPNTQTPLVKLLPHRGPVRAMAVDKSGRYMISASQDRKLSIWDIRMFKELHSHFLKQPAHTISISDRNVTAVGWGSSLSIYRPDIYSLNPESDIRVPAPYMNWGGDGVDISRVRFCPFEDILGISHKNGFSSIIIPGAGEPNPDSLEHGTNPFENTKQRQEAEVHALLEKLQPEMISLDPNFVGNLDLASEEQRKRERDLDAKPEDKIKKLSKKQRGRSSGLKRYLRKSGQKNVITEEKARARDLLETQKRKLAEKFAKDKKAYGPALERFAQKRY
ncbi:BING4CT-domain-containing protein [Lentithecium fluviatile CBS 122367]|uniref:U three protein 7 n=1 Tax=Lentithecium fluviatile CBS 122367 TaxID=1168545 RepID=A0A6G1JF47_9PLEO|nr:BING4CT-domain-containing protein [Lentithecium fluviatile CBS 122367]